MVGGEALVRSGAGYQTFVPSTEMLLYSGFSLLAAIGVLAVLLLALPADRAPELEATAQ